MIYRIKAAIVMKREADRETSEVINVIRMCQAFNTLPSPGGLFDQDACFVYLLNVVMAADEERAALDRSRGHS